MIAVNFVDNPEDNVKSYIFLVVYSLKSCDTDYSYLLILGRRFDRQPFELGGTFKTFET